MGSLASYPAHMIHDLRRRQIPSSSDTRESGKKNEKVEAIAAREEKPVLPPPLPSLATADWSSQGGIETDDRLIVGRQELEL